MGIYLVLRMEGSLRATGGTFKVLSRVGNLSSCQHLGGLRTASFFVEWDKTLKGLYGWTLGPCCRN